MAQRDEGLDRLEAFVATAAQVRATLQRDDGRVRELGERLGEYFGDVEARLEELDDAIEAFDARHGDQLQLVVAVGFAVGAGVAPAIGGLFCLTPLFALLGFIVGYDLAGGARWAIVNSADGAIVAYRGLSEASQRLDAALARAGEESEEAFDEFDHVAAGACQALAEPWLPILSELGVALQGHFLEH